ncbi:MAG: bifunctional 2-polyprenyl-6-hydroxyphenol methylase/3-demethylubiquinol 3-O-methyltransferase UbiG [Rhodospirillales bacterium]|nr:bifunctional 2-polyprenyl-6-hydroxyphenol methylase/3-demethylubiquinol 3-O-methyltransferase UbiG [Alphaproteobacteria bacterium]USO03160.1 MAG: bifunctional 2-polyprenyl-6-hydroxyphenol methylase/3-demethylubiquinol 3-O-methyltransferase UbiG [Rhodospirillales bacterium]
MNTVDAQEIQNFSKDSARWWDERGPFAPLHRLNPARMEYIKGRICARFDRDTNGRTPFQGLSLLDIGCGGGLVCEPLTRLGAKVTGIDADEQAVKVAQAHAKKAGLNISYRPATSEELLQKTERFDIVLALEIVEHVADLDAFVQNCADLCKPGGLMIFSTLNRTPKSFALGIVAAEYILRWVPQGTHSWKKFVRPSELSHSLRNAGARPCHIAGLVHRPLNGDFHLSDTDMGVNYFLSAEKVK